MEKEKLMFFNRGEEGCDIVAFHKDFITTVYNCYNLYELVENPDYDEEDVESNEEKIYFARK